LIAKRLLASAVTLALATAAAHAADLPVKAPILKAPPPLPTWTGFYAGINAGYSFGHDSYTNVQPGFDSGLTAITAPAGAVLGGQLGYNWQVGNLVLGLEGDAQWTSQDGIGCATALCVVNEVPESDARLVEHRLKWFSTLRGRLGWAHGGWLFYVTGGGAWGGVRETDSVIIDFIPGSATYDATLSGWAGGLGAEVRLWRNWTAKFEYLHLDLGGMTNNSHLVGQSGPIGFDVTEVTTSRVTDNIIRFGLNYQLVGTSNGPWAQAYASATPPAALNWTGVYVGVNGGYGVGRNEFRQFDDFGGGAFDASFAPSTIGPKGGLFGGQAGYNWQMNSIVLGIEGDAQWSDMQETACGPDCSVDGAGIVSQKLKWFATARARLGWAMPSWMVYATAGAAWGGIDETDTLGLTPGTVSATSFSQARGGWTAGGGLELRLWEGWTGKLEYLHLDLGSTTNVAPGVPPETLTTTSQIRSDIVRVGLNYKLWN
jgi:outer membrane immunogenic protein